MTDLDIPARRAPAFLVTPSPARHIHTVDPCHALELAVLLASQAVDRAEVVVRDAQNTLARKAAEYRAAAERLRAGRARRELAAAREGEG